MMGQTGKGAEMGHPSPKRALEFRQRAVQPCRERGGTYADLAREIGCDAGSISDWVKKAAADPLPGRREEPQAEEGERAAGRESEMLLKASAFFADRQPWAPKRRS